MHPSAIGPYQILRELGRGGMGEVYLARDTRLDRDVAIKALPAHLTSDADRLARFQREAKVLASLNHPGIGAIYGLEEASGQQYLVLEFIEGETLADLLDNGPIAIDEALRLARQIAEALEAAHEKGVIHRDLKPANVMVTPDGVVKVLDFGLSRAEEQPSSSVLAKGLGDSPTVTTPARQLHSPTIPGVIMGTAGYMSPEQARGKPVDKRSDIFSFGCVLYEMLSGEMPFRGETVADAIGATLHKESDLALLPTGTPRRVIDLLTSCLAKDRRNRLHDIGDARLVLDRAIVGQEWTHTDAISVPTRAGPFRFVAALVMGAALLGAGWLLAGALGRPSSPGVAPSYHVSTPVPSDPELGWVVGIAPDASFVVYQAWPKLDADSAKLRGVLVVRRLDRDETTVLEGTEGSMDAALSGDGRWLAFAAAKDRAQTKVSLKKIALDDGRTVGKPETLCDLPAGGNAILCWSSDREIVIALAWQQTILAVSALGGQPRVVLQEERSKEIDNWGVLRPLVAGRSVLASRWALVGQSIKERTEIVDLVSGTRTPLMDNAGSTQLVGDGFLVTRRNQNTIIAQRFDAESLRLLGDPVTVWNGRSGSSGFFVSQNGTLAINNDTGETIERRLMWLDDTGQPQPIGAPTRAYEEIALSPDGGRVAYNLRSTDVSEIDGDLWVYDLARRTMTRLPTGAGAFEFVWSDDAERLVHTSITKDEFAIWERRTDGSGEAVKLHATANPQVLAFPQAWSPDQKTLAIAQVDLSSGASEDVVMLEREGDAQAWKATPYLSSPAFEHGFTFSPDGRLVMFCSTESGSHELYVQPFTGVANGAQDARSGRVQISTNGNDGTGWWSPDATEIRYIDLDKNVMSVQVQTEPRFTASLPKLLYSFKDLRTGDRSWSPDGRLMVVLQAENERPNRIELVINFADTIRARFAAAQ